MAPTPNTMAARFPIQTRRAWSDERRADGYQRGDATGRIRAPSGSGAKFATQGGSRHRATPQQCSARWSATSARRPARPLLSSSGRRGRRRSDEGVVLLV